MTSGLYGVAYTDAYQFGIFLIGNIILVPIVLAAAGGMDTSIRRSDRPRRERKSFFSVIPPAPGLDA